MTHTLIRNLETSGQSLRIKQIGEGRLKLLDDLNHRVRNMKWRYFILSVFVVFFFLNAGFALLYMAGEDAVVNARPGHFWDYFMFSIHTTSTVGYGIFYPRTTYGDVIMAIESGVTILLVAIVTGLCFTRFSRPTARVAFTDKLLLTPYDGRQTLMFRVGNRRANGILQAEVRVSVLLWHTSKEGFRMRRFYDLPLMRSRSPLFLLTWTVMHPVTEDSPLYGMTEKDFKEQEAEFVVTVTGVDDTFAQSIHSIQLYGPADLQCNRIFSDIMTVEADGTRVLDYTRFNDTKEV